MHEYLGVPSASLELGIPTLSWGPLKLVQDPTHGLSSLANSYSILFYIGLAFERLKLACIIL